MDSSAWPPLAAPLLPAPDEVLLVSAPIDLPPERLAALRATFTPHEEKRADRFATEELRSRWTAGRGLLRELLAGALGADARAIRFRYREHGKPELDPSCTGALHGQALSFNVSHSRGRALYALARGREVGVDLEEMRPRKSDGVADRFYAPEESAALRALTDDDERRRSFFFIWSAKEAFIKATGLGLSQSLSSFTFALARIAPPAGLECASLLAPVAVQSHRGDPLAQARWSVYPLSPAPGFSGALIAEGLVRTLKLRSWDAGAGAPPRA